MPRTNYNATPANALHTYLQNDSVELAVCAKIERLDGVTLGFTSWDASFTYDGTVYQPSGVIDPGSVKQSSDLSTDFMDVVGALSDDSIKEEDLIAGKYDYATITIFVLSPSHLAYGHVIVLKGNTGETVTEDGQFKVEVRSLGQKASQEFGDVICQNCRAIQLGAPPCAPGGFFDDGKTMADYTDTAQTVTVVTDDLHIRFNNTRPTNAFTYGIVTFTSGPNDGVSREIRQHTNSSGVAVLFLADAFPFPVTVGDEATLICGCDRLETTCQNFYNNRKNMQAELWVPGNDKLIQTGRPPS